MTGPRADRSVAVIMAVRDGERYVAEAIDSILDQTIPAAEVVVVDDGSQDRTPAILEQYGTALHVVGQEPSGQYAAMNKGIAAARSPLLAFLDADDLYTPQSLEVRLERLLAADAPDAVFGCTEQFVSPEIDAADAAKMRFVAGPQHGELFQTMLIRRRAFEAVGPLEIGMRTSANIEWISRARAVGLRTVTIDHIVARRRLHRTNVGITRAEEKMDNLLAVIRAHRRRTARPDGE